MMMPESHEIFEVCLRGNSLADFQYLYSVRPFGGGGILPEL